MKTIVIYPNYSLVGALFAGTLLLASNACAQNLFVCDYTGQAVYEYTPGGTQSTFANGMNYPFALAFNTAGDLFVANTVNNAIPAQGNITEITPNGTPSTFASGIDPTGLAFNSAGNLFEADYRSGNIYEYTPAGVQSTYATGFGNPISMTFDSEGDLFVGSGYGDGNGIITKITPNGTQSLFASGLSFPGGMTFNSAGDLLVTSQSSGTILEYTPGGAQSTFATLNYSGLNSLTFNNAGDLFVAAGPGPIVEITPGGGQSVFATETAPVGLAFLPVPEPSTFALLGIGAAAMLTQFRRLHRNISRLN